MQIQPKTLYQFGPFEVNADSGELLKNGRHVSLQEQPFRLLVVLLEKVGEIVGREELRSRIWSEDTFVDFDGSLRVAVRKLREPLGDNAENPRYIETVPKRGYLSWPGDTSGSNCTSAGGTASANGCGGPCRACDPGSSWPMDTGRGCSPGPPWGRSLVSVASQGSDGKRHAGPCGFQKYQLGRAYAITGDKAQARSAYQDFFRLWKNADVDVPVLQQAKAEYEKLQ